MMKKKMINNIFDKTINTMAQPWDVKMSETIRPYKARASPKINIKIIPTKILSCCAFALTPASPTIPIARPAAFINQNYLLMN